MIKFAITGNIACGKSFVYNIIKTEGFSIIDVDDIVKELYKDKNFIENAKKNFPEVITNNEINLKTISKLLFSDKKFKIKYETFIFPIVKEKIIKFFDIHNSENKVFVVVPLLFEAGFESLFDKIIFIQADENIRLERLIQRNSMLSNMAEEVIKFQMSEDEKIPLCDFVIKNNGTLEEFKDAVEKLIFSI